MSNEDDEHKLTFESAIKIATKIEEDVLKLSNNIDYNTILKISIYTANKIRSVIPRYVWNSNLDQIELYNTVIEILEGRLNKK